MAVHLAKARKVQYMKLNWKEVILISLKEGVFDIPFNIFGEMVLKKVFRKYKNKRILMYTPASLLLKLKYTESTQSRQIC